MKKGIKRAYKLIGVAVILALLLVLLPVSTVLAGSVSGVSDTLTTYATGATPTHTIAFTTATDIPVAGTITITFPSGFDISSIVDGDVAETLTAGDATWAVSDQVLTGTIATATCTAGAQSVVIGSTNYITSPSAANTYTITVDTSADDSATCTVDIRYLSASDTLSGTDKYYKSASNDHTIVLNAATAISASASIVIDLNTGGFSTSSILYSDVSAVFGTTTMTVVSTATPSASGELGFTNSSNTITLKMHSADAITAGEYLKIVVGSTNHVTNPSTAGQKTVNITTKDSGDATVDEATCKVRIIDGLTQDLYEAKDTLSGFNATRLTADVAASGTVLPVEDASGFAQYDRILLRQGDTQDEIAIVSSADTPPLIRSP